MARRTLSYSEVETALTCFAKWDFNYGGRLAGDTLKPKIVPAILSRGSAWGAVMQAWHTGKDAGEIEFASLSSLRKDQDSARKKGVHLPEDMVIEQTREVMQLFAHYREVNPEPFRNVQSIERHMHVRMPGRGTKRSNRYWFEGFLDLFATDPTPMHQGEWLIETKLRGEVWPVAVLERSSQLKWYCWAYWMMTGRRPAGVISDTWLALIPNEPRMKNAARKGEGNADGKVLSTAKDQVTTVRLYQEACRREGVEPDLDLVEALSQRVWGQRATIGFTQQELVDAGNELVAAAKLIGDLDSGKTYPIRHATPRTCGACRYKGICTNPGDTLAVDSLFKRDLPKRLLPPREGK